MRAVCIALFVLQVTREGMKIPGCVPFLVHDHSEGGDHNEGCIHCAVRFAGHTRGVKIPGCVPFQVTTNACRGFCLSYAIPSPTHTVAYNPNYIITSRAECCGIIDTHDVSIKFACSFAPLV